MRISNCALCDGRNCFHQEKTRQYFAIGKYNFGSGISSPDKIWIEKNDGDGMEVPVEEVEKLLDEWWEKEF